MGRAAEGRTGSAGGYSTPLPASHSSNAVREVGRGRDDCRGVDATHALHFELGCRVAGLSKISPSPVRLEMA